MFALSGQDAQDTHREADTCDRKVGRMRHKRTSCSLFRVCSCKILFPESLAN